MKQRNKELEAAIRWIRKNCQVDTGSGIYGWAKLYTPAQIRKAILEHLKSRSTQ